MKHQCVDASRRVPIWSTFSLSCSLANVRRDVSCEIENFVEIPVLRMGAGLRHAFWGSSMASRKKMLLFQGGGLVEQEKHARSLLSAVTPSRRIDVMDILSL